MTMRGDEQSVAIHVGVPDTDASRLVRTGEDDGCSVLRLNLASASDVQGLCDAMGEAFMFPYRIASLDAALDLWSDLEWFGNDRGYLVVVAGADDTPPAVLDGLVAILPAVADRWRSQGVRFTVALTGDDHRERALLGLGRANQQLREAALDPWDVDTDAVRVFDRGMEVL